MSVASSEQPAHPDHDVDADAVLVALAEAYDVSAGPSRVVRRRRVDTFDWRLAAAGLHLVHESAAGPERLLLTGASVGGVVEADATGLRWPLVPAALPACQLRQLVARPADIRALVVHGDQRYRVRRVELRNDDGKIVCRLELADTGPGTTPEVELLPLRGYGREADDVDRRIRAVGVRPGAVLGGPPPRPDRLHGLDPEGPAVVLLALELREFLDAIRSNVDGVVGDVDTEFLHDLRVAVRRTRATLKLGRPVLPRSVRTEWEPRFKAMGDLTTPLRDLDVYQLDLPVMVSWLVAADADDLQPFGAHLAHKRTVAWRALARELRKSSFGALLDGWDAALVQLALAPTRPERVKSSQVLAHEAVRAKWRQVVTLGRSITDSSPPARLHELRKRLKELRYALEVFEPVLPARETKAAVGDVKRMQDVLGRYQDTEVQRSGLRVFADEMLADGAGAATMLAMGELVAHLDAEQRSARDRFRSAFERFDRRASRDRFRSLGGRG